MLRHGIFEMHFIQEIRFLKAYYWAHLGKYAFTPVDRIEWTKRAEKDFDILGIPSETYCNQDPANFYYAGFPADLRQSPESPVQDNRNVLLTLPINTTHIHENSGGSATNSSQ